MAAYEEPAENLVGASWMDRFGRRSRLAVYTALLLLSSVGNQVYFKRMTSAMPNYGWYLTQLSTFIYVPFFLVLAGTGVVEHAKRGLVRKFAVMGLFDGLAGTLMVLGGVHTSGTMQVLLGQAVIPLTIVFSVAFLNKRFHMLQHAGAAVIILGILLAKMGGRRGGADDSADNPVFNVLFFCATVPSALSSVFKEVAFRGFDGDLDVNVLQFWVATFQFATNFAAMPIYTLDVLGPQKVPLSDMAGLSVGGTKCLFMMQDQVLENCGLPGERPCDHCRAAWVVVATYLSFNVLYNVFLMLVIKHGSAALSFLVATLRMPLASLAFSSTYIMGRDAVQPGPNDFVSLLTILAGLCTYRYGGRLLNRRLKDEANIASPGATPFLASPSSPASPADRSGPASPADRYGTPSRLAEHLRAPRRRWTFAPLVSTGLPAPQPTFALVPAPRGPKPRSADRMRQDLYRRLGAASPLQSPRLRGLVADTSGCPEDGREPDFAMVGLPH